MTDLLRAGIAHLYNRFCYWQKFQSSPSPVLLLHVSTVAQVPVLALAKFNHGQLQCEFVQTVLVIKMTFTLTFSHRAACRSTAYTALLADVDATSTSTKNLGGSQRV